MSAQDVALEPVKIVGPEEADSFWQPVPANGFIRNILNQKGVGARSDFSLGTQTVPRFTISAAEAVRFVRSLPRGGSPKQASWVTALGRGLRLSQRETKEAVRITGPSAFQMIRCNGPPGAARASTRRLTAASASKAGAWCGFGRASITSAPSHPQCFCRVKAPTPSMSAAGSERVNVTQSRLFSVRAVNSLSSASITSGNVLIPSTGVKASAKRFNSSSPVPWCRGA